MTELPLLMIRIRGVVECNRMTVPARVRQILILIVDVALVACNSLVCTDELERCSRVIECRRIPNRRRMARRAILPEARQHVPRVHGLIVLRLMTGEAVRVDQLIVAVHVALHALQ